MSSLHVWKARKKAVELGGFAGDERAAELWDLSKRELVELVLRLTDAGMIGDVGEAVTQAKLELETLRMQGIV